MFEHVAVGQLILRVAVIAESGDEALRTVIAAANPHPPYPVREERERRIARGEVLACSGKPGVEEVEVRPRVGTDAVAGNGAGEESIVVCDLLAVVEHFRAEVAPTAQMGSGEVVAESVAERGEAGVPEQTGNAVESAVGSAAVAAHYGWLALAWLHLFHVLHERHDDLFALVWGQTLPYPVVGGERKDARS